MTEYIDREALLTFLDDIHEGVDWVVNQYNADWIYSWIEGRPVANAVEVKHGRWIRHEGYDECDLCHTKTIYGYRFCPDCGARMDGERK